MFPPSPEEAGEAERVVTRWVGQLDYDESENATGGGSVLTTLGNYGSVAQHESLKQIVKKGVVGRTKK